MLSYEGVSLVETSREAGRYCALVRLDTASRLWAGHFPGHPILPGIAHLGLAMEGARALEDRDLALVSTRGVRFRRPVRPGETVELVVTRPEGGDGALRFELRCGDALVSSGTLVVTADARG